MTESTLQWRGNEWKRAARAAEVETVGEVMAEALPIAQDLAPVESGELHDGLFATAGQETATGATAAIGGTADHTLAVEIGTSDTPAVHMLRRATDQTYSHARPRLAANMRRRAPR